MNSIIGTDRRDIENCVLGSMALLPEACEYAVGELDGREFLDLSAGVIFAAMRAMLQTATPIDGVTLADTLARAGQLESAGGAERIGEIITTVPHAAHVRYYVDQLKEHHHRDRLRLSLELARLKLDEGLTAVADLCDDIRGEAESIVSGKTTANDLKTPDDALREYDERVKSGITAVRSGLSELDNRIRGGFRPGQLVVVAGRPGMGKSALMCQLIWAAADAGKPAMVASLEMTSGEIAERVLTARTRNQFANMPVRLCEAGDLQKILSLIRLDKRKRDTQLVAVDYLQIIEAQATRNESREQRVAAMSRALKRLAMELRIPILLGSQLNRASEKRDRPSLGDLRESGAIEQDADIVLIIHGNTSEDDRELIIAKQRGGPCGQFKLRFDRQRCMFESDNWEPRFD